MKGISPIIASVLLIAITMSIAVILAAYVTSYTRTSLTSIPSSCVSGTVNYASADYPDLDTGTDTLTAVIETYNVALKDFSFDVIYENGTVTSYDDANNLNLAAGGTGTVRAVIDNNPVSRVRVATATCSNIKTDWATPA